MALRYRVTRIDLDALSVDDMGTVSREELQAMAKLPGWHMVRNEDGTVWLNVDGLGWERLHVCNGKAKETNKG